MTHEHAHHGHDHSAPRLEYGRSFMLAIALNLGFVVVEALYGILSHSMALVADAGHNLGDVLGLGLSWGATLLAKRTPTVRHTYGLRSTTILASVANGLLLLFVTGGIAWESVRRLFAPAPVAGRTVVVIALIGVVVNGLSSVLFIRGQKRDLNVRSAFLHLASDAALSLCVALMGAIVIWTGLRWLDPAVSLLLSLTILSSTWTLLKDSLNLVLHGVPEGIDLEEVKSFMMAMPGVAGVHDLHVWAMSTTETALTAHLALSEDAQRSGFAAEVGAALKTRFAIGHSTLQLETKDEADPCRLTPKDCL